MAKIQEIRFLVPIILTIENDSGPIQVRGSLDYKNKKFYTNQGTCLNALSQSIFEFLGHKELESDAYQAPLEVTAEAERIQQEYKTIQEEQLGNG